MSQNVSFGLTVYFCGAGVGVAGASAGNGAACGAVVAITCVGKMVTTGMAAGAGLCDPQAVIAAASAITPNLRNCTPEIVNADALPASAQSARNAPCAKLVFAS